MARKNSSATAEADLEFAAEPLGSRREYYEDSPLDARILALNDEEESPFLRGQKRVPVRRGALPHKAAGWLKMIFAWGVAIGFVALVWLALHTYTTRSWRFRLDSSDNIDVVGTHNISRGQVLDVLGGDIDRNIFFVPLELRQKQLEQMPWVQSASVMRLLPDRLQIVLNERTPVAYVQVDSRIELIDASGVIMEQPLRATNFSFPVIVGMSDTEPLSTRAARMKIYARLMQELDSTGAHYSRQLSDIDLSDPDDVKASVMDPAGAVLVHLGSGNFLERFKLYVTHVQEWRTQFPSLKSVDLRYEHQVIVNPDIPEAVAKKSVAHATQAATEKRAAATKAAQAGDAGKKTAQPAATSKKPVAPKHKTKSHT